MNSRDTTRKITYAAVCVALSVVSVLISYFSPAKIVPLVLCSLSYYIAFCRCGIAYGVITLIASVTICFFISGISTTFLFLCIVFAPYALIAFFMRKLSYSVGWQLAVRLAVTVLFFAVAFIVMILLFDVVIGTSLGAIVEKVGKVWAGVLIVIAASPMDLFFSYMAERIIKMLK